MMVIIKNKRKLSAASLIFLYLCTLVHPVWATSGQNTYVFAASACPPWKTKLLEAQAENIAHACKNDVELFTASIKEALNVPSENIFIRLNEQATYSGVQEGLKDFAEKVPKDARVIMLFNFHGDLTNNNLTDESGQKEEFFVLWTEDKPFTLLSALALKQWMTASELRKMIDAVRADEIVITIDACHAGQAAPDILKNHGRDKSWQGREAVMASSKSKQFSYFTVNGAHGLFTLNFSNSIRSGSLTVQDAFNKAAKDTNAYIESYEEKCSKMLRDTFHENIRCKQTPIVYDPTDLLPSIKLNIN